MFQIAKGKYEPGHVTGVKWLIFTSSPRHDLGGFRSRQLCLTRKEKCEKLGWCKFTNPLETCD